jgi:two-component system sensor histidine kinase AgrC
MDTKFTLQIPLRIRHILRILITGGTLTALTLYIHHTFYSGHYSPQFMITIVYSIIFYFFANWYLRRFLKEKAKRKVEEQKNVLLQHYTYELEQQYLTVDKVMVKHLDTLSTLSRYLEEDNLVRLKDYYQSITNSFAPIPQNTLQSLDKIKIPEIKSILAVKLMEVKHLNIVTSLEIDKVITVISSKSYPVVRMLGIILNNAIESLEALRLDEVKDEKVNKGKLSIGCFTFDEGVYFLVENTCHKDIPPLHQLFKEGFSTKGDGRGLGLANFMEISAKHPEITTRTIIKDRIFSQQIIITNTRLIPGSKRVMF